MDLTWSADEDAFRAEARAWLETNHAEWRAACGGEPASGDTRAGFAQHLAWERRLFDGGWAAVSWPEEHGGRGASLWEWLLFEDAPAGQLDRGVWDSLDAMGVLSVLVPEDDAGLGLDETYLAPILEECGRVALPHPIVETAMVAVPLLGAGVGMVSTDLGGPLVPCAADATTVDLAEDRGALVTTDAAAVTLTFDRGALGTAAMLLGLGRWPRTRPSSSGARPCSATARSATPSRPTSTST